jgi:hypothetical protein
MMSIRHGSDHRSALLAQQPKNGAPGCAGFSTSIERRLEAIAVAPALFSGTKIGL